MATWKCVKCGWDNSESWEKCAKCGLVKIEKKEYEVLLRAEDELMQIRSQIENIRTSNVSKWEYLVIFAGIDADKEWKVFYKGEAKSYNKLNEIIDELGQQGWELISISSSVGSEKPWISSWTYTFTSGEQLYFKRPYIAIPKELQNKIDQIIESVPNNLRERIRIPR
jgi:hypothetical protein